MIAWMILAASVASAQDCQPVSSERLSSMMQEALLDFATLDEESFHASVQQANQALPCLDEVFLAPNAAAYHRLMALEAFFDGQDEAAVMAFRAAQRIEPNYEISAKLAPEGGRLHRLWLAAQEAPNPFEGSFRAPAGNYAFVDGAEGTVQAEDLPSIVQYGIGDGSVAWTGYLQPGETPPTSMPGVGLAVSQPEPVEQVEADESAVAVAEVEPRVAPAPEPVVATEEWPSQRRNLGDVQPAEKTKGNGKGGLIAATVVSGLAAGGLYGGATVLRSDYDRHPTREGYLMTNGAFLRRRRPGRRHRHLRQPRRLHQRQARPLASSGPSSRSWRPRWGCRSSSPGSRRG